MKDCLDILCCPVGGFFNTDVVGKIVIPSLAALATVLVAILAIWGDWIRAHLAPSKLAIELPDDAVDLVPAKGGKRAWFYHLKVVNKRRWRTPRNCRVLIRAVGRQMTNGDFQHIPVVVPMQYAWAPLEVTPIQVDIHDMQMLDFGILAEGSDVFSPRFYWRSGSFQGDVRAGEVVRYFLQIVSDGFVSKDFHIFEVAWDGQWSDNQHNMLSHLVIKEIRATS